MDPSQPCEIEQSISGSISCSVKLSGQTEMRFKHLDAGSNKTEYDLAPISPQAVFNILQTGVESIVLLHCTKIGMSLIPREVNLTLNLI